MLTHVNTQSSTQDSDIIFIKALKITTCIGVYEWEKAIPQSLVLDLQLAPQVAFSTDTLSDELNQTIDYAEIIHWLKEWIPQQKIQLIETLADTIAKTLLQKYPLQWLEIIIQKPNAQPSCAAVGIQIKRHQPGTRT